MADVFKTLIVSATDVEDARALAAAEPSGEGMFTTALSPTGEAPATHYVSSGYMAETIVTAIATGLPEADISDDEPFAALARLDLKIVQTTETQP